jgi:hypothetical protein
MRHLSLAVRVVPAVAVVVLAACADRSSAPAPPVDVAPPPPPANGVDAQSFSRWTPSRFDTCTREQHDAYSAIGPDGKRYPTWHPPVDPSTGCRFGHEHGADPSTSPLFRTSGPILFGYANEKLFETDPANARDEDHVGHKIEVLTGMRMRRLVALDQFADAGITCDLLMKMHQGTHSADAFGNNVHEVHWYQRCSDGSEIRWNYLAAIGNPSEIMRQCTRDVIRTVPATPVNSPQGAGNARALPSSTCEAQLRVAAGARSDTLLLKEDWAGINFISAGPGVVMFDPYFDVANPSRLHTATHELRRTIDLCRGSDALRMRSAACDEVLQHPDMTWDDPRSPFNGARRQLVVNTLVIDNRGGPTTWYTDPYGRRYSPTPFPGSIRQYVAAIANNWNGIGGPPAVVRDYGRPGTGVHAPN